LTALYAQSGKDSIVCYTQSELVKIANKMTYANECDSLNNICEKQLKIKTEQGYAYQMAIYAKDTAMTSLKSVVVLKEGIISGKDLEIVGLRDALKKDKRRLRWTRIGWLSTSGVLVYILLTK
jgi:hypothetical protein